MEDKENLVGSLAHWLAAGKLEVRLVLPVIQNLAGAPQSLVILLEQLDESSDPAAIALAAHLREFLRKEALRFYENRKAAGSAARAPSRKRETLTQPAKRSSIRAWNLQRLGLAVLKGD